MPSSRPKAGRSRVRLSMPPRSSNSSARLCGNLRGSWTYGASVSRSPRQGHPRRQQPVVLESRHRPTLRPSCPLARRSMARTRRHGSSEGRRSGLSCSPGGESSARKIPCGCSASTALLSCPPLADWAGRSAPGKDQRTGPCWVENPSRSPRRSARLRRHLQWKGLPCFRCSPARARLRASTPRNTGCCSILSPGCALLGRQGRAGLSPWSARTRWASVQSLGSWCNSRTRWVSVPPSPSCPYPCPLLPRHGRR